MEMSPLPRNKYPEETVKKILDASLRLFLEKGFEQTTVLDIVDNLGGLTRGAFYHHFKSKDDVLEAIFLMDDVEHNIFEMAKQADLPNGLERVKYVLKTSLRNNVENKLRKDVTDLAISLLSSPRFLAEHVKSIQETARMLAVFLDEGMADGSIKPGNSKAVAELFFLLVNFWMLPNVFPPKDAEELHAKGEMIDKIFDALGYGFPDDEMAQLFFNMMADKGILQKPS